MAPLPSAPSQALRLLPPATPSCYSELPRVLPWTAPLLTFFSGTSIRHTLSVRHSSAQPTTLAKSSCQGCRHKLSAGHVHNATCQALIMSWNCACTSKIARNTAVGCLCESAPCKGNRPKQTKLSRAASGCSSSIARITASGYSRCSAKCKWSWPSVDKSGHVLLLGMEKL